MREEEKGLSSRSSKMKRFFKKRWVFPAVYIASAALILTAVLWFQNNSTDNAIDSEEFEYNATGVPGGDFKDPAIEVNSALENIVLPLNEKDRNNAVIQTKFYDDNAKAEDQEAAIVVYENQYHPNNGIDIKVNEDEAFGVVAALSGTVTKVQEDKLLGNVIEIEHDDNVITHYSSVSDMKVEVGDEVKQGQALATAGKSMFNEEAGVHVHFEIRKDGVPVNPESYLNKPVSELQEKEEAKPEADEKSTDEKATDEKATEGEDAAKDEKDSTTEEDEKSSDEDADKENADQKEESKTNQDA